MGTGASETFGALNSDGLGLIGVSQGLLGLFSWGLGFWRCAFASFWGVAADSDRDFIMGAKARQAALPHRKTRPLNYPKR